MNSVFRLLEKYNNKIKENKEFARINKIILILGMFGFLYSLYLFFTEDNLYSFMVNFVKNLIIYLFILTVIILLVEYFIGCKFIVNTKKCSKMTTSSNYNEGINNKKDIKKNVIEKTNLCLEDLEKLKSIQIIPVSFVIVAFVTLWFIRDDYDKYFLLEICSSLLMLVFTIFMNNKVNELISIQRKSEIANTNRDDRLKILKDLLKEEKICPNDITKIQVIIDELIRMKGQRFLLLDIKEFLIKPFIILGIPVVIVALDKWVENQVANFSGAIFFYMLLIAIVLVIISCLMIVKPVQILLYGKYDALISDLRLLQITKEENDNQ